jgi:hypothetical protein
MKIRDFFEKNGVLSSLMFLLVLFFNLALGNGWPASGPCSLLFPKTGSIIQQDVMFQPGGRASIPMLITDRQYIELWSHLNAPLIGPPAGGFVVCCFCLASSDTFRAAQYGEFKQETATYNESSSCEINLYNNFLITPNNLTYTPQPGGQLIVNVMQSGTALLNVGSGGGQIIGGVLTRLFGLACEGVLADAQEYLAKGVPRKYINVSVRDVCYS